jgi:hypothetical protein
MSFPAPRSALLALLFLLPIALHAQSEKHPKSAVIMTELPKDKVFDRAASALVGAGYTIAEANQVAITTVKRTFKNVWDLQLSVNVLSARDSSRVVVTGLYWVPMMGVNNEVVEGGHGGVKGKMWEQLQIAADSLRNAVMANR